jgi:uncharacterized protein (TIGR00106 family)
MIIGKDVHLHSYVEKVIQIIKKFEINYEVNDMATILEIKDLDTLFNIVREAHAVLFHDDINRIITEIKIDNRKDKDVRLGNKRNAVL